MDVRFLGGGIFFLESKDFNISLKNKFLKIYKYVSCELLVGVREDFLYKDKVYKSVCDIKKVSIIKCYIMNRVCGLNVLFI